MIELRLIHHALAVAKFGSFRKAADALYLTQPTLTRSIQALEESLGAKLFDRGKRKVEPTPMGRIFLARAEEIIKAASELKREIDLAKGLEIGQLEIGTGTAPAELLMGTAVGRLSQRYPHLYIYIKVDNWAALTHLLLSGRIELFVAETSEVEVSPEFLITPLTMFKGYVCCRQGHPLSGRPHLTLKEALEYPLVMGKLPHRVLASIAETCGIKMHSEALKELPLIRCENLELAKAVVASSNAVAFILLPWIERELESGEFVLLPVDFPELKTHFGIVQISGRTLSPAAEIFTDLLRELDAELALRDKELLKKMLPIKGRTPKPILSKSKKKPK